MIIPKGINVLKKKCRKEGGFFLIHKIIFISVPEQCISRDFGIFSLIQAQIKPIFKNSCFTKYWLGYNVLTQSGIKLK